MSHVQWLTVLPNFLTMIEIHVYLKSIFLKLLPTPFPRDLQVTFLCLIMTQVYRKYLSHQSCVNFQVKQASENLVAKSGDKQATLQLLRRGFTQGTALVDVFLGWVLRSLTLFHISLTHWGRVTHICVSKLTIIGSDNGLLPDWRQAIIWTNAGILLIRISQTNFSEILSKIHKFSFPKMHLKMSSAKWQ